MSCWACLTRILDGVGITNVDASHFQLGLYYLYFIRVIGVRSTLLAFFFLKKIKD